VHAHAHAVDVPRHAGYPSKPRKPEPWSRPPANAAKSSLRSHSASLRWGGIFDLDSLRHELDRLNNQTLAPGFWDDQKRAQKMLRERSSAEETLTSFGKLETEIKDLGDLVDMAAEANDQSMVDEVAAQLDTLDARVRQLELKRMLADATDNNDAIVTIAPGAGGIDAQDWAEMVMRMYLRWCDNHGFKTEILSKQPGDEAGIKDASFIARGPYAYGFLRAENGVHRLIRISPFDANHRRQTAFAAVSVVPDLDDDLTLDGVVLKPEDLEVQTMRSGGSGGQHVNRTESAIRIKHVPSGFVVRCDSERSQHQNRDTAMKMLRGLLYEKLRRDREAEFDEAFVGDKSDNAFGSQIRTYTLQPYTMVKDERTDYKMTNVQSVLDGDVDPFIESYLMFTSDRRMKKTKKSTDDEA
jgi:peptide chain release factor 2